MKATSTRPLATLCLLATALAAAGIPAEEPSEASKIRAEFQRICTSIKDSPDPFYGERKAQELRKRLDSGADSPAEVSTLQALLGRELLKLGETEQAITLLTSALQSAPADLNPSLLLDMKVHLALAHYQAAEDVNCVLHHSADSCILPFRDGAIHQQPRHSRRAGDLLLAVVKEHPRAIHSRWLLNLSRMASGDYPEGVPAEYRLPGDAFQPQADFPRWHDRAPEIGVAKVDLAGGAVMDDFDGDGLLDLVSSTWDPCGSLKAFRNNGRGGFEEVTAAWGLDVQWGGLNLVHADYDGDGRPDLLVLRGAWMGPLGRIRNSLLRNELDRPGGGFVDVTRRAGLAEPAYPTQTAAWADYDGDGDLDLYVGNEDPDGASYPSQLFRNDGDGTFTDVAQVAGTTNMRYAKAVTWGDYDDDGDPDLYVSNIGPNRLYRNNGDGTFSDVASRLGVTAPEGRSFASWFFDFDNDGDLDLFVADYSSPVPAVSASFFGLEPPEVKRQLLYRNDGGRFSEVSAEVGLTRPILPMGANYGDLDNDGWLDFYLGTGEPGYETIMPNVMFRNVAGRRFQEVTFAGGFGHLQKGHGVAFGDIDNDGDQDLFHQLGGFFPGDAFANALYENPTDNAAWLTLRLEGRKANSFAVGARVEVRVREGETERSIHSLVGSGGTFGGSSLQLEVGLGAASAIEEVVIRWPGSGTLQRFSNVALNRVYRAVEGKPDLVPVELPLLHLGNGQH